MERKAVSMTSVDWCGISEAFVRFADREVKSAGDTDSEKKLPLVVMGHSLGGAVASCLPKSLATDLPHLKSVLVMAPALDI